MNCGWIVTAILCSTVATQVLGASLLVTLNCEDDITCNQFVQGVEEISDGTSNLTQVPSITVIDYNECNLIESVCSANATCQNVFGTFLCQCNSGFQASGVSGSQILCTDINECENGTLNTCPKNSQCTNSIGGFSCTCNAGYNNINSTSDLNCTDINECEALIENNCSENTRCINFGGGFRCECNPGYVDNDLTLPPGTSCTDIDECVDDTLHNCTSSFDCANFIGGFSCKCGEGFISSDPRFPDVNCIAITTVPIVDTTPTLAVTDAATSIATTKVTDIVAVTKDTVTEFELTNSMQETTSVSTALDTAKTTIRVTNTSDTNAVSTTQKVTVQDKTESFTTPHTTTASTVQETTTIVTTQDITTDVFTKDAITAVTLKNITTAVTTLDMTHVVTPQDKSTQVTTQGITTQGITTDVTLQDITTQVTTQGRTTHVTTQGRTTDVTTQDMTTQGRTTDVTTQDIITQGRTTDVTTQDRTTQGITTDVTTQYIATQGRTTDITTREITTQGRTTDITTQEITTQGRTTDITTQEITTQGRTTDVTTQDITTQGITTDVSTQDITTQAITTDLTTQDITTQGRTTDVTTQEITTQGRTTDVTTQDITTQGITTDVTTQDITTHGITTDVTTQDITTQGRTTGVITHDMTTQGRTTDITTQEITTQGRTTDVTTQDITIQGITTDVTTQDITTQGKTTDVTTQDITSQGRTTDVTTQDITTQGRTTDVTTHDITSQGRTTDVTAHDITSQGRTTDVTTLNTSTVTTQNTSKSVTTQDTTKSHTTEDTVWAKTTVASAIETVTTPKSSPTTAGDVSTAVVTSDFGLESTTQKRTSATKQTLIANGTIPEADTASSMPYTSAVITMATSEATTTLHVNEKSTVSVTTTEETQPFTTRSSKSYSSNTTVEFDTSDADTTPFTATAGTPYTAKLPETTMAESKEQTPTLRDVDTTATSEGQEREDVGTTEDIPISTLNDTLGGRTTLYMSTNAAFGKTTSVNIIETSKANTESTSDSTSIELSSFFVAPTAFTHVTLSTMNTTTEANVTGTLQETVSGESITINTDLSTTATIEDTTVRMPATNAGTVLSTVQEVSATVSKVANNTISGSSVHTTAQADSLTQEEITTRSAFKTTLEITSQQTTASTVSATSEMNTTAAPSVGTVETTPVMSTTEATTIDTTSHVTNMTTSAETTTQATTNQQPSTIIPTTTQTTSTTTITTDTTTTATTTSATTRATTTSATTRATIATTPTTTASTNAVSNSPESTAPPVPSNLTNDNVVQMANMWEDRSIQYLMGGSLTSEETMNIVLGIMAFADPVTEVNITEEVARTVFRVIDLLGSVPDLESNVASAIISVTEVLLSNITLENGFFELELDNLYVGAIDVGADGETAMRNFSLGGGFNSTIEQSTSPTISLPTDLFAMFTERERISFTAYEDATLFQAPSVVPISNNSTSIANRNQAVINSGVIGATVADMVIRDLPSPVQILLPLIQNAFEPVDQGNSTEVRMSIYNPRCVFYDMERGEWSEEGCVTVQMPDAENGVLCQCNHLTSFAVLMSVETSIHDSVLNILTYIGCGLSVVALFCTILTYTMFRPLRKHKSKRILVHFCISLFGVYVTYILGIAASLPSNDQQCVASGFFMQFFTTSTFSWMFIEILDMYLMFVKIWSTVRHYVRKSCIFGWGFPAVLSIVTLGAHFGLVNNHPRDEYLRMYPMYRPTVVCWLTELSMYWAFLVPMGVIMLVNVCLFSIVLYHVTCKRSKSSLTRVRSSARGVKARQHVINAAAIILLSGPTWVIGFLINIDPNQDGVVRRILSYLFVIFNAFQGLWIFLVFTIRPKMVRNQWIMLFRNRRLGDGSTSSSWGRRQSRNVSGISTIRNPYLKPAAQHDHRRSSALSATSVTVLKHSPESPRTPISNPSTPSPTSPYKYRYSRETSQVDNTIVKRNSVASSNSS